MTLLAALVAALCWVIGNLAYAQEETSGVRLVDEDVRIPVNNGNYTIAARILRPDGDGPYGAVVLNHGAAVSAEERRTESSDLRMCASLLTMATTRSRRGS